jgi:hypothetical protein
VGAAVLGRSTIPGEVQPLAWSRDGKFLASGVSNGEDAVRIWDVGTGNPVAVLFPLREGQGVAFSADGHYRSTPLHIERDIVYVVQTEQGQQTYTPEEFEKKFGWKNDPSKVRLTAD